MVGFAGVGYPRISPILHYHNSTYMSSDFVYIRIIYVLFNHAAGESNCGGEKDALIVGEVRRTFGQLDSARTVRDNSSSFAVDGYADRTQTGHGSIGVQLAH
jgi:hypothetical protein